MTSHAAVYQSPRNFHDSLSHIVTFNISPCFRYGFRSCMSPLTLCRGHSELFLSRCCCFLQSLKLFWSDHTRNRSDVVMFFSYVLSFVSVTFSAAMGDCSGIIGLTA